MRIEVVSFQTEIVEGIQRRALLDFKNDTHRWDSLLAIVVVGQQTQHGTEEGIQQRTYPNMTPSQRADATRTFLGLGAVPDKIAAERGKPLFLQNCAFCHGQRARGATAPSLITSEEVLADDHGEHLTPFLKEGIPGKGMPAFAKITNRKLTDIAEFLHLQVEAVANRGAYQVLDILVGDAVKGKAYVDGHCMTCHTASTFEHIASEFRSPDQLQRNWIWPSKKEIVTVSAKSPRGMISGRVVHMDDFQIALVDASGDTLTLKRDVAEDVQINDLPAPHQEFLMTLANRDMQNVTAYLESLK